MTGPAYDPLLDPPDLDPTREGYGVEVDVFRGRSYLVRRELVYHHALWVRPGQGADAVYWVRRDAREMQRRFNSFFAGEVAAGDLLSVGGELLLRPTVAPENGVAGDVLFDFASVDWLGRFHARG